MQCLHIQITPIGEFSCEERSICYSPVPAYSPSNCFMHMDVSNKKPKVSCGQCVCNTQSAAVDIGIVIFGQSSHSNMLLTPTVFSFHSSLPCSFPFLLVIPTSFNIFKCFVISEFYFSSGPNYKVEHVLINKVQQLEDSGFY